MALTEGAKGEQLMTGSAANLFSSVAVLTHFAAYIYTDQLQAGDTIHIVIYVHDPQDSTERIYDEFDVTGVQTKTAVFIPFLPTDSYRITAQQTAGTNRTISWVRYEA